MIKAYYCYDPTSGTTHLTDLVNFLSFHLILSNCFRLQTMRKFSMRTHLSHILHHFTNMCLPHGKPYSIKPNLILDSSFPCCAWLCCHIHAHHTCSMLLFHSATTMWLHHMYYTVLTNWFPHPQLSVELLMTINDNQ